MSTDFDKKAWQEAVEADRAMTKEYYLNEFNWRGAKPSSSFEGPRYFPLDERWRVAARLDKEAPGTGQPVQLQTSVGDLRDFVVAGTFVFRVGGADGAEGQEQEYRLTAYSMLPAPPDYTDLFVPFKDATTGKESYGAGRYIDVPWQEASSDYTLDFNMAYNPSCAYSPRYNCPYPPPQNTLKIAVTAGEKTPFPDANH